MDYIWRAGAISESKQALNPSVYGRDRDIDFACGQRRPRARRDRPRRFANRAFNNGIDLI